MSSFTCQLLPACRRRNHVIAAYASAAAATRTRLGPERVERFALDAGVPAHVVARVLTAGGPRRPWAPFHEFAKRAGLNDAGSAASAAYFKMPAATAPQAWAVNRRGDEKTALLIDAAINVAASHGVAGAAAELIELGFPVDFVFRVLCSPRLRRRYLASVPPAEPRPAPGELLLCRRRNRLQAAYVNAALTISQQVSVKRAEAILVEQGVPERVIARVLHLNGQLRRQGDMANGNRSQPHLAWV